jgi:hypothetical protein
MQGIEGKVVKGGTDGSSKLAKEGCKWEKEVKMWMGVLARRRGVL